MGTYRSHMSSNFLRPFHAFYVYTAFQHYSHLGFYDLILHIGSPNLNFVYHVKKMSDVVRIEATVLLTT